MPEDLVIQLDPGKTAPVPGNSTAIVRNDGDQEGKVTWKLNPPPVTQGTVEVPPHQSRTLPPFGATGGTVENTGKVTLTLNIQTKP